MAPFNHAALPNVFDYEPRIDRCKCAGCGCTLFWTKTGWSH